MASEKPVPWRIVGVETNEADSLSSDQVTGCCLVQLPAGHLRGRSFDRIYLQDLPGPFEPVGWGPPWQLRLGGLPILMHNPCGLRRPSPWALIFLSAARVIHSLRSRATQNLVTLSLPQRASQCYILLCLVTWCLPFSVGHSPHQNTRLW